MVTAFRVDPGSYVQEIARLRRASVFALPTRAGSYVGDEAIASTAPSFGSRTTKAPPNEEPLRAAVERGAQHLRPLPKDRRERCRNGGARVMAFRVLHLGRDGVERPELDGRRKDRAGAVADDSALRGDGEVAIDLVGRPAP